MTTLVDTHGPRRVRTPEEIGAAIRARRKALGLTQEDVAAQTGLSRPTVGAIEGGKDTAQIGIVLQVCADLGLEIRIG